MIKKIITKLFLKYCYDEWTDSILKTENKKIMEENGIEESDLDAYFCDMQQQIQEGAYDAGIEKGYELAVKDFRQGI